MNASLNIIAHLQYSFRVKMINDLLVFLEYDGNISFHARDAIPNINIISALQFKQVSRNYNNINVWASVG